MIAIGFYLLTALCVVLVSLLLASSENKPFETKRFGIALTVQLGWLAYIFFISNAGLTAVPGIPPRIVEFLVAPALIGIILFNTLKSTSHIIVQTPLKNIVLLQSFRIVVEILLFLSAKALIVPKEVTFEGNNYDIVIGITAPIISILIVQNKISPMLFRIWNFAGLATLAIVVTTFMAKLFLPTFKLPNADAMIAQFGNAPFTFLPGYLMPLAVGLTIMALKKSKSI